MNLGNGVGGPDCRIQNKRMGARRTNDEYWYDGCGVKNFIEQVKLKLREAIACYFDKDRSGVIPAGEIVEPTSTIIDGKIRVHWSGSKEGMGFVMVGKNKLELCADRV